MAKKLHLFSLATYILTFFVAIFEFILIDRVLETELNSCPFLGTCNYDYSVPHLNFLESFLVLAILILLLIASGINIIFHRKKNFWLNICFNIVWVIQANTSFHVYGIRSMFYNEIISNIFGYFLFAWCILSWISLLFFIFLSLFKKFDFKFTNVLSLKIGNTSNRKKIIFIVVYIIILLFDLLIPLLFQGIGYSNPFYWIVFIALSLLIIPLLFHALPAYFYIFVLYGNCLMSIIFCVFNSAHTISVYLVCGILYLFSLFALFFSLHILSRKSLSKTYFIYLILLFPFAIHLLMVRSFNIRVFFSIISFVTLLTFLILNFISLNKQKNKKNYINDKK